jgi:hypothetical protein
MSSTTPFVFIVLRVTVAFIACESLWVGLGQELTEAPWGATLCVRKLRPVAGERLSPLVFLPLPPGSEHCSAHLCPGLFFFTFLFYLLSIAAVALMFVYYTESGACHEGKVFISLNLTFCVCVSIIAVLPKVQVSNSLCRCSACIYACTPEEGARFNYRCL